MSWFRTLMLGAPKSASAIGLLEIDPRRRTLCGFDGTTSRAVIEERLGAPNYTLAGKCIDIHVDFR